MQPTRWRAALDHVVAIAQEESCTLVRLDEALRHLSIELEREQFSAFAFISETAADSCSAKIVDAGDARLAVLELCQRIATAIESSRNLDFSQIDITLQALLFPESSPAYCKRMSIFSATGVPWLEEFYSGVQGDEVAHAPAGRVEHCVCNDEQFIREFLSESMEHLQSAEQIMLSLEGNSPDEEAINGLFRVMHSLKGSAGVLELKSLSAISHLCEGVLVQVREGRTPLHRNTFQVILLAVDAISAQINSLAACYAAKQLLVCPLPPRILITCLDELNRTGECSDKNTQTLQNCQPADELVCIPKPRKASAWQSDSMRVDGKRLEQLIDLIGELVVTDVMVQRELRSRDNSTSAAVSSRLRKVVREVQQLSLTLKMVPIGTVLHRMRRMVRDLAEQLNKQVEIRILGADTEVDKTLLECIADPLIHLIRNSLDHGIESTIEERLAAGKPAVATIWLKAEHRGGCVHLQISDDGRGLNRPKILQHATELGLADPKSKWTHAEIDELIFTPGFSTAAEVTEISGRGVGMDVVRKNIESMRGSVSIVSVWGRGTEVNIELPLTLSIIDGTLVRVGERCFIIPTLSVVEQMQYSSLEFSGNVDCRLMKYRSRYLRVHALGDVIGSPHAATLKYGQVVIVVESGGKQHGLVVDEVLGQQPIVIKPLGSVLSGACFFAGGALLSDGKIGFVLDLNTVCSLNS